VNTVVVFDLGKVLVEFDHTIAARKIAARSRKSPSEIKALIEQSRSTIDYETGRITRREFFDWMREAAGFQGRFEEFSDFCADIFSAIPPMIELHAGLHRRGIPTYVFSNTNELAIEYVRRHFPFFQDFDGYIYSYEVGAMKPDAKIYEALEQLAGRRGADIVYLDDKPENVAGGTVRGWQAILHETPGKSRAAVERICGSV